MFKQIAVVLGAGALTLSSGMYVENMLNSGITADQLANSFVGDGITISNVMFSGSTLAAGIFSGGSVEGQGNSFLQQGIALSSGSVVHLNNSKNTSDGITGDFGLAGDGDLNRLIPGFTSCDAAILEFDFIASGVGDVTSSFWYVFGSEEYDEYVNTPFSDVLGFFLDGTNIALIPGTSTPVSINSVNASEYSGYFNQNNKNVSDPFDSEMDGFTTPFRAEFTVSAGSTHHLRLAIGDALDPVFDSWVLLGGNSFITQPAQVPEPGTMSLMIFGLIPLIGYGFKKRK